MQQEEPALPHRLFLHLRRGGVVQHREDALVMCRTRFPRARYMGLLRVPLTSDVWGDAPRKDVTVPRKFPPEFKRDVVTVARRGDLTIPEVAADFDISPESARR